MPKGSAELTNARKQEIINACADLYETIGFNDITIRDIGAKTSFSRTSIYNYFHTKEEIFLALLQRDHERWTADLEMLLNENDILSAEQFADRMAVVLEKRQQMLKLMSMNLYDLEGNSRMENLVAFKRAYAKTMQVITSCLEKFFPEMTKEDVQEFLYAFFPFLFGVYPYTSATEKQKEAMDIAHIEYPRYSIYEITKTFVTKILKP